MKSNIGRRATGDAQPERKTIKAGDMLLHGLAAGNADPQIRPGKSTPMQPAAAGAVAEQLSGI
ncbi:MAG TPA: hypothetical protein VNS49_11480 [Streptomyces sp.]|nr:hypothetical protein [Streptomyces sp.]